jgi:UDP:flavonoid glycosyltransferase YjiC (YdhE family)
VRVLFSAAGAYSHVLPMAGVARALADAGHDVLVATSADVCPEVDALGFTSAAAGMSNEALVSETRRRWPETAHEPPSTWALRMFAEIAAPTMLGELADIVASWRPHVVVREEGEFAGPVAAEAARIPWVTHGWGAPLAPSAGFGDLAGWLTPLWVAAGLEPPSADGLYGAMVFDPCPTSIAGASAAVAAVRQPVRPTTAPASHERWGTRRTADRPLAYLGFGTVPLYRDAPDLMTTAVESLLSAGYDVVVTTGDRELASVLTKRDPDRVRVETWIPMASLFSQCALVVCHGGAGTVLTALAASLPLLLLPRGAPSQRRMSDACRVRGVARVVEPDGATRRALDQALAAIDEDDGYRAAAREMAAEIAMMPSAADAVPRLESCTA